MTVIDLMDIVTPRLTGPTACTLFEALREVQAIIANRLLMQRSDMLREELSCSYLAGVSSAALDSDFLATSERPYVVGKTPLNPLNRLDKSGLQTAGEPKYYDIVGKTLWIYPPPDANTTVKVPAFVRPNQLTALTDTLPFFGDLDSVFVEGCVAVLTHGLKVVGDSGFVATIQNLVDQMLLAKNTADEQVMADAINYGG